MTFSHCVLISPRNYVCDVWVSVCPLGGCSHWLVCLSAYTHKINPPILAFCPLFFCALWLFLCFYFGNIISFGPPRFHLLYALFFEWCVIVHTCNCLMLRVCVFVRFFRVFLVLVDSIFALAPSRIKFVTFFIMIFASLSVCVNVLLFNGCYLYYIKLELGLLFFFCALLL